MKIIYLRPGVSLSSLAMVLLVTRVYLVNSEDTLTKLFSDYDKSIRPDLDNGKPTTIGSGLYVESFGNIEEANMEYRVFIYFRQTWTDARLAGKLNSTLVITREDIGKVWVPDLYCYNARESNLMIPDEEVHSNVIISPNGNIFYSRGVNILASCLMDLRHFPLDQQSCYLKFGSYSYSTNDLIFQWTESDISVGNEAMAQFTYNGATLTSDIEAFVSGNYSTITVTFSFERRIGYYLIQVYFPDIFVVALSWIVFWMEQEDMGNRMTLGITSILTIMFLLGSLSGSLPKVSYPKALDWYLIVSFAFVFFSMVESMIVFVLNMNANGEKKIKCKTDDLPLAQKIAAKVKSALGSQNDVKSPTGQSKHNGISNLGSNDDDLEMVYRATKVNKAVMDDGKFDSLFEPSKKARIADATDKISRILFPFAFMLYNVFYWVYY